MLQQITQPNTFYIFIYSISALRQYEYFLPTQSTILVGNHSDILHHQRKATRKQKGMLMTFIISSSFQSNYHDIFSNSYPYVLGHKQHK